MKGGQRRFDQRFDENPVHVDEYRVDTPNSTDWRHFTKILSQHIPKNAETVQNFKTVFEQNHAVMKHVRTLASDRLTGTINYLPSSETDHIHVAFKLQPDAFSIGFPHFFYLSNPNKFKFAAAYAGF